MDEKKICLIGANSDLGVELAKMCEQQKVLQIFGVSRKEPRNQSLYEESLVISNYESDKEIISSFVSKNNVTDIVLLNGFIGNIMDFIDSSAGIRLFSWL